MYMVAIAGIVLIYDYIIHPQFSRKEKVLLTWLLIMIVIMLAVDFYTVVPQNLKLAGLIKGILKAYVAGPLVALFVYRKLKTTNDLIWVLKVVPWFFAIPAMVAILQYLKVDWAWRLPLMILHHSTRSPVPNLNLLFLHSRATGLYALPISFTFQSSIGVSIAMFVAWLLVKGPKQRLIYGILSVIAILGGLSTATRSLLLAILFLLSYLTLIVLNRQPSINKTLLKTAGVVVSLVIAALGVYSFLQKEQVGSRLSNYHDVSRPQLWKAALILSSEHPFGVGPGRTPDVIAHERINFIGRVNLPIVTNFTSHNYWLNQLTYWGIPGVIVMLFITIWPFLLVKGPPLPGYEWMKHLVWAVLIALYINSFFHNGGLGSMVLAWYVVGIAMLYNDHKNNARSPDSEAILLPD